jgi:amino acid adenylation domain-containing protein/non-ribosomal peptide synthase protein (TIGR01720 family)
MNAVDQRIDALSDSKKKLLAKLYEQKKMGLVREIPRRDQTLKTTPLSSAQIRIWYTDQLSPGKPVYNMAGYIKFAGELNVPVAFGAFNRIMERHEILRTIFINTAGVPEAVVREHLMIQPEIVDLSLFSTAESTLKAEQIMLEVAGKPMDLSTGPLFKLVFIKLPLDEWMILNVWHHIIADGMSSNILLKEFVQLYNGSINGETVALPELPIQYADYSIWQRALFDANKYEAKLQYWKQHLAGSSFLLELPADYQRPLEQSFQGERVNVFIPLDKVAALKALSQKEGVTLFVVLLAALKVLLYRYTGQKDIIVGVPFAGRDNSETEKLIGCFLNMMPIRNLVQSNQDFKAFLKEVQQSVLGAFANQEVPFEHMVDQLQISRSMSYNPVYQVVFSYENSATQDLKLAGRSLELTELNLKTAKLDLTLELTQEEEGIKGWLEFNTTLFSVNRIRQMVDHYLAIINAILDNSEQSIGKIPLLTTEEHDLLESWNSQVIDYPRDKCIHQLIAEQAEKTPESIAVVFGDQSITYQELNDKADSLAGYLQSFGVKPEERIGILTERSIEMLVGIVAILKAGAAYVPLDPAYPKERIAFMIGDSQIKVLVTQKHLREEFFLDSVKYVCLDKGWEEICSDLKQKPLQVSTPEHLAYIIYTSGSTGVPKGVAIEHRNAVAYLYWAKSIFTPEMLQGTLAAAPISFDMSTFEILMPLISGTTIIIAENVLQFPVLTAKDQVTLIFTVPSIMNALLQQEELPRSVRTVIFGGEYLRTELVRKLYDFGHIEKVYDVYGPTETTTNATFSLRSPEGPETIGQPIANTQIYILDGDQNQVPIGVPGEIYICGSGVARGYLDRPQLTGERFIKNPFSNEPGKERLYKTGDLGRYFPDGNIEYLGRSDNQVKLHGLRIELGEIETALMKYDGIKAAAAVVRNTNGDKKLYAYVTWREGRQDTEEAIKEYLVGNLPKHFIPHKILTLDAMPLSPNGKTDYKTLALLEMQEPDAELERQLATPRNDLEGKLYRIWQKVLNINEFSIHDSFFNIGGDSILCLQVIAKASQEGIYLKPKQFFECQTLAKLAAVAEVGGKTIARQKPVTGPLPLTPIQKWFFSHDLANVNYWNQAVLLNPVADLAPDQLNSALNYLVKHHDALRLKFYYEGNTWNQINTEFTEQTLLKTVDLAEFNGQDPDEVVKLQMIEVQSALNLGEPPLIKAILFRNYRGRALLVITAHHLVVDGVSWRILLEDLQLVYNQLIAERPVVFPEKTTSYKQWAEQLVTYSQSEKARERLTYWLETDYTGVGALPSDYQNGFNRERDRATVMVSFTETETVRILNDATQNYSITINQLFLAALGSVLSGWAGNNRYLVDLESHGRVDMFDHIDVSRTVGWFTAVYPCLIAIDTKMAPGDALKAIKGQMAQLPDDCIEYSLIRFGSQDQKLVENLKTVPKSDIIFNYLGKLDQENREQVLFTVSPQMADFIRDPANECLHKLEINGYVTAGQLYFNWNYSKQMFKRETVATLVANFKSKLLEFAEYCINSATMGFSSLDFPNAELNEQELDAIWKYV